MTTQQGCRAPTSWVSVATSPAQQGCGKHQKPSHDSGLSAARSRTKLLWLPGTGSMLVTRRRRRVGRWVVPALPGEHPALHKPLSQGSKLCSPEPTWVLGSVGSGWTLGCSGCPGPARGDAAQRLPQSQPQAHPDLDPFQGDSQMEQPQDGGTGLHL